MIKVVSWNIAKREEPWRELVEMDADVALLQEAGSPPGDLIDLVAYEDTVFWNRHLYDRWPLVVKLSDRVEVKWFKQVLPISDLGEDVIGVSGIGTIDVAKVTPVHCRDNAFIVVSMYARWLMPHPSVKTKWLGTPTPRHTESFQTCRRSSATSTHRRTASSRQAT